MSSGLAVSTTSALMNHEGSSSVPAIFHQVVFSGASTVESLNWAGYAVSGPAGSATQVTASFNVPTIQASKQTTYVAFWAGLDGYSSGTVEQAGILAESAHGKVVYMAWTEFYPAAPTYASWSPAPGDVITVTVTTTGMSQPVTATVTDSTTGASYTNTATNSAYMLSSAEWIVERPSTLSGLTTLANFGIGQFGSAYTGSPTKDTATISQTTGSIGSFVTTTLTGVSVNQLSMVSSSGGPIIASPSALSGDSFTVAYNSGSSSGGGGGGHGGHGGHGGSKS